MPRIECYFVKVRPPEEKTWYETRTLLFLRPRDHHHLLLLLLLLLLLIQIILSLREEEEKEGEGEEVFRMKPYFEGGVDDESREGMVTVGMVVEEIRPSRCILISENKRKYESEIYLREVL